MVLTSKWGRIWPGFQWLRLIWEGDDLLWGIAHGWAMGNAQKSSEQWQQDLNVDYCIQNLHCLIQWFFGSEKGLQLSKYNYNIICSIGY